MAEKQKDPLDVEENVNQESSELVVEEAGASTDAPAEEEKSQSHWIVVAVTAVLTLCAVLACVGAILSVTSGGAEETPTPAPVPTKGISRALIAITAPSYGQVLDITRPIEVQGKGIGLPEGNVIVEILDAQGNVLAQQPTTLQGKDVGIGGEGTWSVKLTVSVEPGTAGKIWAYSSSPADGKIIAEDVIDVSLGKTAAVKSFIQIDRPAHGEVLDATKPIAASGSGAGLPEGNVVVQVLDGQGNVLTQQPTTLQGKDVATGGEGSWSVNLMVNVQPGTPVTIRAFSSSPADGKVVAEDAVAVNVGNPPSLEGPVWVWDQSLSDVMITASFEKGRVSGSAGCNTYRGSYVLGSGNAIQFSPLATTRMMCEQPVMELETKFLTALESVTSYTVEGDALLLSYPGGTLVFYVQTGRR